MNKYIKPGIYKLKKDCNKQITISTHVYGNYYKTDKNNLINRNELIIPRGGKRPGAGRPKGTIPKKQQCIYLPETTIFKAEKIARTNNVKKNKIYETAIQQYIELL